MRIKNNQACSKRLDAVAKLAGCCPADLAEEIIVIGSVSRGLADDNSDIELIFVTQQEVAEKARLAWLQEIGASEVQRYCGPLSERANWLIFRYAGYWFEAGWQQKSMIALELEKILTAEVYSHEKLLLASMLQQATGMLGSDCLKEWQIALTSYPQVVQEAVILDALQPWTKDLGLQVRRVLAERDDRIPLLERIIADMHRVLRILFALNRQWEPDWKWIPRIAEELTVRPPDLAQRINTIVCLQDPEASVRDCFALIRDTLALLPEEWQTRSEVRKISEKL